MTERTDEGLRKDYGPSREPATLYADNFYVTGSSVIIRIAFGESAEEPIETKYRVAVALSFENAKELATLISNMTQEIEKESAAGQKE